MKPLLREIATKKVKIVSNAGGINVDACRQALEAICLQENITLRIGTVHGDDLLPRVSEFASCREMFTGSAFPSRESITSVNAYLGASPIVACLDLGCDIVITGRVVDSALVLGPLLHEFPSWINDTNLLAAGTLVGHVLECGAQSTGGLFTDCMDLGLDAGWWNIGYPIASVGIAGDFVLSKPPNTGGLICVGSVCEQILYEIADPCAYIVPDVVCDFSNVRVVPTDGGEVRVSGAKGRRAPSEYKVCATFRDGFKISGMLMVTGQDRADSTAKADATGNALIRRITNAYPSAQISSHMEFFGSEKLVLKITLKSDSAKCLSLFGAEFASPATSMAPGTCFMSTGKPRPTELVRLFSFLIPKKLVQISVRVDARSVDVPFVDAPVDARTVHVPPVSSVDVCTSVCTEGCTGVGAWVPLSWLCFGRSGDKGDNINIALIARDPLLYPIIQRVVSPAMLMTHFAAYHPTRCDAFLAPGFCGLNFLLHNTLNGGGMASMFTDSLGKGFGQEALRMKIGLSRVDLCVLSRIGFETRSLKYTCSSDTSATVTLVSSTMSNALVQDLTRVVTLLEHSEIKTLTFVNGGKNFCAGADLNQVSLFEKDQVSNEQNAMEFATLFHRINRLPQFVTAVVEGHCVGGGMGLVSCCDYVIGTPGAKFGLPEVNIGMVPATIYPYVQRRIGARNTRKLTLMGTKNLSVVEAKEIGLVDEIAGDSEVALSQLMMRIQTTNPNAVATAKAELVSCQNLSVEHTGKLLAKVRISPDVREGVAAMKQKRPSKWAPKSAKL